MKSGELWQAFLATGAPEIYLLYKKARRTEVTNVLDNTGPGATDNGLQ